MGMTMDEFFRRFENLDLMKRDQRVHRIFYGELTPLEIYRRLKRIEQQMEPLVIEATDLLKIADEYFDSQPKPRLDYRE